MTGQHKGNFFKTYAFLFWQLTGEALIHRADDNPEALKKRLESYHRQTKPLVDYYGKRGIHHEVDAAKSSSNVFTAIQAIFSASLSKDKVFFVGRKGKL